MRAGRGEEGIGTITLRGEKFFCHSMSDEEIISIFGFPRPLQGEIDTA